MYIEQVRHDVCCDGSGMRNLSHYEETENPVPKSFIYIYFSAVAVLQLAAATLVRTSVNIRVNRWHQCGRPALQKVCYDS
jgi:hypothetical protein